MHRRHRRGSRDLHFDPGPVDGVFSHREQSFAAASSPVSSPAGLAGLPPGRGRTVALMRPGLTIGEFAPVGYSIETAKSDKAGRIAASFIAPEDFGFQHDIVAQQGNRLLTQTGFQVRVPLEAHLCCGSAGTHNILQPQIAVQLGDRKAANLDALGAQVIATGNIGCAVQIGQRAGVPVVHTVELLDWATGGPRPDRLGAITQDEASSEFFGMPSAAMASL